LLDRGGIGMPKKALLLAAGKGTRLGPITADTPKPLLNVGGKPVLRHLAELCAQHGVEEVFINTHHLAHQVRTTMGDGSDFGLRIQYSFEDNLLGTAGALQNFRDVLAGDDFFVLYGDNLMDYDLTALAQVHAQKGALATLALYEKEDVSQSGIAVLDPEGRVMRFIEKPGPHESVSNLVNCGLYVLSPAIFDHLPQGFSDFGRDVFPALLRQGVPLYGAVMDRPLVAIDTVDLFEAARDRKAIFIDRDGILNRVILRGDVIGSPRSLSEFELLPEGTRLVQAARRAGFCVVVVTNQPDVARGPLSQVDLAEMHGRIQEALAPDSIQVCTSADNDDPRRKPNPGMLLDAATSLNLDLSRSVMIGDSAKDIGAGTAAGVRTLLLQTDYNRAAHGSADVNLDSHAAIIKHLGTL
jgi:mannose-1-phosphate guanylyltransferase/phosphomannomutase